MREKYNTLHSHGTCECGGTDIVKLKPQRIDLDELNTDPPVIGDYNFFAICFDCKNIVQFGYGDVEEMEY